MPAVATTSKAHLQLARTASPAIDFDVRGLVGVRLVDATERDAAVVARQLGPLRSSLDRKPDIVIRYVDRIEYSTPIVRVGHDDAGFDNGDFMLMRGMHRTRLRTVIPLDRLGAGLEIVCEHGAAAIPILVPLVNAAMLPKGVLPLHASAFVHEGVGVVVTGWSMGGKTDALLGFAARGATYVGDDWVYVVEDGGRVLGLPEPVRLWDRQLRCMPAYWRAVPFGDRARLRCVRMARAALALLPPGRGLRSRARALFDRQLGLEIAPQRLFGPERMAPGCSFDVLFLAVTHGSPAITVEAVDPLEVAVRASFSLEYERSALREAYEKFRFAFPSLASIALERCEELERRLLRRTFGGKPAYLVRHPEDVTGEALADAMAPYCRDHR